MVGLVFVVIAALTQLYMAYMGVRLTIRPPLEKNKRRHEIGFIAVGLLGVASLVIGAHDSNEEQAKLQNSIDELKKGQQQTNTNVTEANSGIAIIQHKIDTVEPISKGTPSPAKKGFPGAHLRIFKFEVLPPSLGNPVYLNVNFENIGLSDAEVQGYSLVGWIPNDGNVDKQIETENTLSRQLPDVVKKGGSVSHNITSNSKVFVTDPGPIVASADELAKVQNGKYLFFFVGTLIYKDARGSHETRYCVYSNGNPNLSFLCRGHNEEL